MKKYFSLIAVAMFAVSSVFTSCSKDGAGSSYNPNLEPNSNLLNNTQNSDKQSAEETVAQWAEKMSSSSNASISICFETVNGETMMSTDVLNVPGDLTAMIQKKLSEAGVEATVKGTTSSIKLEFKAEKKADVIAAVKSVTPSDVASVVECNANVKAVYLTPSWNLECSKIVWKR